MSFGRINGTKVNLLQSRGLLQIGNSIFCSVESRNWTFLQTRKESDAIGSFEKKAKTKLTIPVKCYLYGSVDYKDMQAGIGLCEVAFHNLLLSLYSYYHE